MTSLRFTEKEIALLYEHTQAPYLFDALIQGTNPDPSLANNIHDIIGKQSPDVALLTLSLCGLVVARDIRLRLLDKNYAAVADDIRPVSAELDAQAHECLYSLGRLWLDSVIFELDVNPMAGLQILRDIPTNLQVLTSIFAELRDMCEDADPMRAALNILYYQAESHADLAEGFVENMFDPPKARKVAVMKQPDIPLPLDLQPVKNNDETAKIIPFSVFAARSRDKK